VSRVQGIRTALLGLLVLSGSRPRDPPVEDRAPPPPASAVASDSFLAGGEAAYLRGQFDSARGLWQTALRHALTLHDSASQGRILTWLGLAAYRQGDYGEARRLGERALEVNRRAGSGAELARSYNALGLLAWNEGRLGDATVLFSDATRAARAALDETGLAKAANNLALVNTELGNFEPAREGFLETRRAGQRLHDPRIEGGALTNLGMLDIQLGAPWPAIASLRAARALYRSIGYETGEQNVLGQLGTAYDALGEPGLAFAMLDSALDLSRKEGLRQEEASNVELLAGLHRQAGDLRQALALYGSATTLNDALGLTVEQGTDLASQAEIQAVLGRPDLAREYAARALEIHRAAGARLPELRDHLLLADLAAARADRLVAAGHLRAAHRLAVVLDARTGRAEVALGEAAIGDRAGDGRVVLRALRQAAADLTGGDYATEWHAAALRARAHARLGELDSAAVAGREAVAAVERVRGNFGSAFLRASYAGDKADAYADLVDVLLRLDRPAEAFEVADAGRSRALLEHLGGGAGAGGRPTVRALAENEALLRRIDTLVARLDADEETPAGERGAEQTVRRRALAAELAAARGSYEAALVRLAERDGAGAALLGSRRVGAREVRSALVAGEVLLEYLVTDRRVLLFAVTRDGIRTFASDASLEELSRRVRLARYLLAGPSSDAGELDVTLRGLYDLLVAPSERAGVLEGARRLIIVPHAVLAYLPFAALRREGNGGYLMEKSPIEYLPSAAALVTLRRPEDDPVPTPASGAGAAFAPFPARLPGSLREARTVGLTMPGATIRSGAGATEASLRTALGAGGIVHVATHGLMNVRNPMFSRIELAPGTDDPADDGRLEVHELLELRIQAPLVFLSGCETGVGSAWSTRFTRGEDYATLAQAFLYAGAREVMATLWAIRDDGAAAFAQEFYAGLPTLPPADALAAAQRRLSRGSRYSAPYYWAGYQVSGDPGAWPARTGASLGP
jgi:CHAT domain-containing protein/tetratricopeptide (TPR) repeat protein